MIHDIRKPFGPKRDVVEPRSGSVSLLLPSSEILLAGAIVLWTAAILLRNDPGGLNIDPDSYMRLARFRDGYGIFHGGFTARDNAPYGSVVPWTMPFDGALALFYAIGRAFTDPSGALYFAARVVSPFFCVTVGPLIFFGLRPFFSLRARVVMAGLAATAPALIIFSNPGDADHHAMIVWLSVVFAVASIRYLFLDRPRYWHAAAAGIAAAIALWTSPEEFIVVGTGLSAVVLHRCMVERPRTSAAWVNDLVFGGAFTLTLTVAWLADPPYEGLWASDVDRLSIVYVSFSWLFAATLMGLDTYLSKAAAFSWSHNLAVATLLGGAAFACWVAIEPDILRGPLGQADRALFGWIDETQEMQPLWRLTQRTAGAANCLIVTWIGLALVIAKSAGPQRRLWIACAILMIPVTLIGVRYLRSTYFAEVLGSIPLGLALSDFTRRFPKYIGYGAVFASTGLNLGTYNGTALLWDQLTPYHEKHLAVNAPSCNPQSLSAAIAPIANTDAIVMTELDFAPMILYLSSHLRTVASPYIRDAEGILDQFAFFYARTDDKARAILDKRGVTYVLICDTGDLQRADFFGDRILHGTPAWLQPITLSSPQPGFRLYRIRSADG